jgi:NAD-dependent deacetylase
MEQHVQDIKKAIDAADIVYVFTGAGASADSGIPTFRGNAAAFWAGLLGGWIVLPLFGTPFGWKYIPQIAWPLYDRFMRRPVLGAKPNVFHNFLGELYLRGKDVRVVTQNVDGLHQRGGLPKERVCEIHGTLWRNRCTRCDYTICETEPQNCEPEEIEFCPRCDGWPRPDATLFYERLPAHEIALMEKLIYSKPGKQPVVFVVGLSGTVGSSTREINAVTNLPNARVFNVNPGTSIFDQKSDWSHVPFSAGSVFGLLAHEFGF